MRVKLCWNAAWGALVLPEGHGRKPMKASEQRFDYDRTSGERRKNLSDGQVKDLELAGGVERGMQAGSAGGPSESGAEHRVERGSSRNPEKQPAR